MKRLLEEHKEYKQVFVGIDVHKKSYSICVIAAGEVVKAWTMPADGKSLADQLKKYYPKSSIFSAYEAGFSGFSLHRVLLSADIKNIVVNAGSISVESNSRVKTDKRDARKISEQLSFGKLRGIYVPSEEEEARRSLSRGREQVVRRRTRIGNQLKSKLHYLGVEVVDKRVCNTFMDWVKTLKFNDKEHQLVISELIEAWNEESRRIKRFDEALKDQAEQDGLETVYRSVPGIGKTSSRVLANELGDLSRFSNERQLFSATGLTPSEYSSGEHIRRGSISRQGISSIRNLLVEVSWRAISKDGSLRKFYMRIAATRGSKRAIIAVARKIIGRVRACFKEKTLWRDLSQAPNPI